MDEDFEKSVEGFSDRTKEVMREMVSGDARFHGSAMASELPFYDMLSVDEDGFTSIVGSASVTVEGDGASLVVSIEKSDECGCWFFKVESGNDEFRGILNFNTLYNAKGMFAFAFINDNDGNSLDDMTQAIPYTTFFAMIK